MESANHGCSAGHVALRRGRVSLPHHVYHLTATTRGRRPVFHHFAAASAAARCFEEVAPLCGTTLLAWVLMPDHAHWLLQLGDQDSLAGVVTRLKSGGARAVNATLERRGAVWSRAYHDHALRSDEDLQAVAHYIIANPIRAGLVRRVGVYPFWNAIWL